MALFQPLLGNLSGSIGANTFSHNAGGPYVRRRAVPTNDTSIRRAAVRAFLSSISATWQSLTAGQRATWTVYSANHTVLNRLGVAIKLGPLAWYVSMNSRLADIGASPTPSAPVTATPTAYISAAIAVVANIATVTFTPALPAGARVILKQTVPGSAACDPNESQALNAGKSPSNAASPAAITLSVPHPAGLIANYWAYIQDTSGRLSAGIKVRVGAT